MMRKILITITSMMSIFMLQAQETCGTIVTEEQIEFYQSRINLSRTRKAAEDFSLIKVPVTIHIIRQSDGTGGLPAATYELALEQVNTFYGNAGLEFFQPGDINFIDDDQYYDLSSSQEANLGSANDVSGTINIYFSNTLKSTQALCGYTYLPPSADRVFVANGCLSGGTFEHELGHYFSLFHTHGTTNNGTTNEFVNGTNCSSAGDFICDTPADPNLSGRVNASCQYTGTLFDPNNDIYNPMVNNFMSYAPGSCRDDFTTGQYERIRTGFENGRSYLNIVTTEFEARFTSDLREACEGDVVAFNENTALATSFKWTFEGGTPATSTQPNPKVTYESAGTYSVTFEAFAGSELQSEIIEDSYITIENPLADAIDVEYTDAINSTEDFDTNFDVINEDLGISFEYSSLDRSSTAGSGSITVDNFNYVTETYPNTDILVGPTFDIAGIRGFNISFDRAYVQREADASDSLAVAYRVDCEKEWVILEMLGGASLRTIDNPSDVLFQPGDSEWQLFESYYPLTDVDYLTLEIALVNLSYNGNSLFLDNISIEPDFAVEAPFNFRVSTIEDGNFIFRWVDNSSNELAFVVEVSADGTNYETFETLDANAISFSTDYTALLQDYSWIRLYAEGKNGNNSESTDPLNLNQVLSADLVETQLSFSPNPVQDQLVVSNNTGKPVELHIYSLDGRLIEQIKIEGSSFQLNTSSFESGVYILEFMNEDIIVSEKMIKR